MANFGVDTKIENWLKQRGVQFDYRENVTFGELATGWDLINLGRPDGKPVDEEAVVNYASGMENGSIFPSPILAKGVNGYEVLDGCQRLSAANMTGQTIFNAYVIRSTTASVIASIRVCANSVLNGKQPSLEWTIGKVVDVLYEQHRFSSVDCANWSGMPKERIETEINSREAGRWLVAHGVDMAMKPANQKGFQAAFWAATTPDIRERAPKEVKKVVRNLQIMKATNSEADTLLKECMDIKPKKGVDIRTQAESKLREVFSRPENECRMNEGRRTMHPIDNLTRGFASALTTERSVAKLKIHADRDQASKLQEMLQEMKSLLKKIVPHELWREC